MVPCSPTPIEVMNLAEQLEALQGKGFSAEQARVIVLIREAATILFRQWPECFINIADRIAKITDGLCRAELKGFLPRETYESLEKAHFQALRDGLSQLFGEWL